MTAAKDRDPVERMRAIIQGFLDCPEIADCAPEDKDTETNDLERRARALLSLSSTPDPSAWRDAIEAAAEICDQRSAQHAADRCRIESTPGYNPSLIDACIAAEDEAIEAAMAIRALAPTPPTPEQEGD